MAHHELVVALRRVILVEFVELDDTYQLVGILRVCGIACRLQSACPSLIVGGAKAEQAAVALTAAQKPRMVLKTVVCRGIAAETLVALIIVLIDRCTSPAVALYSKVLLPFTARRLLPAPLSKTPCAKVMLAGMPCAFICSMARSTGITFVMRKNAD